MSDDASRLVRQLWLKNRPLTLQRLGTVKQALDGLAAGRLDPGARQEARGEAHRLRGILGTFGYQEGTDLAGEAEDLLDDGADAGGAAALSSRMAAYMVTLEDADA